MTLDSEPCDTTGARAVWAGPVLRLPGGAVLLQGSAVLDVARALQQVGKLAGRDGLRAHDRWMQLADVLLAAAREVSAAAGSAAVPQLVGSSPLPHDLIDTQETAQMLGCRPRNVRDLVARGVLDSGRRVGGRLLIERAEVEAEVRRRNEAPGHLVERRGRRAS